MSPLSARAVRFREKLTTAINLAHYTIRQESSTVFLKIGALVLVAVPVAELAIAADLIAASAVVAPGAVVIVVALLTLAYLCRRARLRGKDDGDGTVPLDESLTDHSDGI